MVPVTIMNRYQVVDTGMHTGMQDVCMYYVVLLCVMHTDFYHNSALLYIHTGGEMHLKYGYGRRFLE